MLHCFQFAGFRLHWQGYKALNFLNITLLCALDHRLLLDWRKRSLTVSSAGWRGTWLGSCLVTFLTTLHVFLCTKIIPNRLFLHEPDPSCSDRGYICEGDIVLARIVLPPNTLHLLLLNFLRIKCETTAISFRLDDVHPVLLAFRHARIALSIYSAESNQFQMLYDVPLAEGRAIYGERYLDVWSIDEFHQVRVQPLAINAC